MDKRNMLEKVHFLKISHHGSSNGMPSPKFLNKMIPQDRELQALLSTYPDVYKGVPDNTMIQMLKDRGVKVRSVNKESKPGEYIDINFPAS